MPGLLLGLLAFLSAGVGITGLVAGIAMIRSPYRD
ncbi:hypothetical protein BH09ACT6_BH09ACT6_21650 [soil metagenome]